LQVLAGSAAQAGAITELNGPRPLEKIGAGELRLWTVNMYTGGTRVSQGFLSANVTGALGTGPVTIKLQAPLASFLRGQRAPKHCRPTLRMLAACWDLWIMHLPATRRSSTMAASDSRKTPALTVPRS
jgi:autotransporter-associated beta strand protein